MANYYDLFCWLDRLLEIWITHFMPISPHIDPRNSSFPGDASPQPPFGFLDSIRSLFLWSIGVPHLTAWAAFVVGVSKVSTTKKVDRTLKFMARAVPRLAGIRISIENQANIDPHGTYVYVVNHVNIFDMFAIYQSIPQYTRSLEHIEHFSWPIFGPLITAAGQIPVDPNNKKTTAKGLKQALQMLKSGDSLVVLPEGQRTLDGTVGHFYPGAFRLAIQAKVPVVPIALHGGRTVSRRGDWRIRPGHMKVIFGTPISTVGRSPKESDEMAELSRQAIITLLQEQNP